MYLQKIYSALPNQEFSPQDIFEACGSDVIFQEEKLGISKRAFLTPEESGLQLSAKACQKLFAENIVEKEDIDLLIYVTQNPDYILPQNSALLQAELALPETCASFDLSLGCSGYTYALSVAKAMMLSDGLKNALIVTCDPYSKILDLHDRDTASIFGDAATVSWLSSEPNLKSLKIGLADYGTSGSKHLVAGGDHGKYVYMNGRAIFNFMMTKIKPSLDKCLAKNNLSEKDIDYFVFHQASSFLLKTLGQKLKIDEKKIPIYLKDTANTISSSIPIVLEKLMKEDNFSQKTLLLCGFGVGLSWCSIALSPQ